MTSRVNGPAPTDLMIRFPHEFSIFAPPVHRPRPKDKFPFCPEPLFLLPDPKTPVPDTSVSLNIAGHTIINDTDFVEIEIDDDDTDTRSKSAVGTFISGVIRFIREVFAGH